jgi:hypothetical protein
VRVTEPLPSQAALAAVNTPSSYRNLSANFGFRRGAWGSFNIVLKAMPFGVFGGAQQIVEM